MLKGCAPISGPSPAFTPFLICWQMEGLAAGDVQLCDGPVCKPIKLPLFLFPDGLHQC